MIWYKLIYHDRYLYWLHTCSVKLVPRKLRVPTQTINNKPTWITVQFCHFKRWFYPYIPLPFVMVDSSQGSRWATSKIQLDCSCTSCFMALRWFKPFSAFSFWLLRCSYEFVVFHIPRDCMYMFSVKDGHGFLSCMNISRFAYMLFYICICFYISACRYNIFTYIHLVM